MKVTASTSQILHVDIVFALSLLYSVTMPAYSMCWPVSGCNIFCCRLFRRRVRCRRSWSYTQWCRWNWWTHLSSKPSAVIVVDGLKPYLSYLFSFEIFDVISVWLLLCYKSSICTVRASITDPGMTLVHSSTGHLRSGCYSLPFPLMLAKFFAPSRDTTCASKHPLN